MLRDRRARSTDDDIPPAFHAAMTFVRTRRKLTAWLGLLAMALVFFAPLVSQHLALHASHTWLEHPVSHASARPVPHAAGGMPAGHDMAADHDMPADHSMSADHDMPADHGMPPEHDMAAGHGIAAGHDTPAKHHAACGYCDLLAHHVPAPAPIVPAVASAPVHASTWTALPERFAVHAARRSGRPRDSPSLT